jgi:hypothetical protein
MGWYAASGSTISPLPTANNGLLITSAGGVPSIGTDIPTAVTIGSSYIYRVGGTDVAVSDGGTGASSATEYMPICGGTTTTGAFQSVSAAGAVAGYVLTYVSNVALPTWQAVGAPYTPSALTRTDDTNVTLTLGGTPSSALLQAVSITAGWTGQLSVSRGGTGLAALTAHYLPIGNGTSPLTLLAPSATSGVPLISQGAAADPAYGTAVVAGGGTGITTATAYGVVCAGTTATGSFQVLASLGNAGEQLTSNGAGALPTWQASTVVTPAALTRTDDTNVTITLGGTPLTALLQATSLTMGWSGQLSLARGGTNADTSAQASNGGIVWSNATQMQILSGTATAGQMLQSGASATPAWSTATWPASTTAGRILYSSANNVVSELTTTAGSVLTSSALSVPTWTAGTTAGNVLTYNGTIWTSAAPTGGGGGLEQVMLLMGG